jgi:hypothetical protein
MMRSVYAFEIEEPLAGGRSTPGVVRVGDTVRRPLKSDSPEIHRGCSTSSRAGSGARRASWVSIKTVARSSPSSKAGHRRTTGFVSQKTPLQPEHASSATSTI